MTESYNTAELRTRFDEMRASIEQQFKEYMNEIEEYNYTYDVDLDKVTPEMLYDDLRRLRAWRNRLAQIIRAAVRNQHRVVAFLAKMSDLHKGVVDEDAIKNVQDRINHGWAVQERMANAGLAALDVRKLVVDASNLGEFTKMVVLILIDKRYDLRDACQEVQTVQGLMVLSMGTTE